MTMKGCADLVRLVLIIHKGGLMRKQCPFAVNSAATRRHQHGTVGGFRYFKSPPPSR